MVGVDVGPGIWHTVAILTDAAVCYEVKPGPYSAANDKDFAPWAPREGDPAAPAASVMGEPSYQRETALTAWDRRAA